jgi:hypothetical protein
VVSTPKNQIDTKGLPQVCVPPALLPDTPPVYLPGHNHISVKSSASGVTWTAEITRLSTCLQSRIVVSADRADLVSREVDPDEVEVQLYVHYYTHVDRNGERCSGQPNECLLMSRRIPLRYDVDAKSFLGRFYPDPSSEHYVFELRVSCLLRCCQRLTVSGVIDGFAFQLAVGGLCGATPLIVPDAYKDAHRICAIPYAGHPEPNLMSSPSEICEPLLHLYVCFPLRHRKLCDHDDVDLCCIRIPSLLLAQGCPCCL